MTWTDVRGLEIGDTFTIDGQYKRRSFMQWLKREPRELQNYRVKEHATAYTEYEPSSKD